MNRSIHALTFVAVVLLQGTALGQQENVFPQTGNVGVGTTTPTARLSVVAPGTSELAGATRSATLLTSAGSLGTAFDSEVPLATIGFLSGNNSSLGIRALRIANGSSWTSTAIGLGMDVDNTVRAGASLWLHANNNVGIGTTVPATKLHVDGTTRTSVLQITGGSDLAEPFEVAAAEAAKPGMLVSIDPTRPGQMRISRKAYDRTVAGVISGANGLSPGLTMGQDGAVAAGHLPVALTGRVYTFVDATNSPLEPGDLLTTSDTPGHAMKVTDHSRAQGAIIGKAMSSLANGRGLVLTLVSLQ